MTMPSIIERSVEAKKNNPKKMKRMSTINMSVKIGSDSKGQESDEIVTEAYEKLLE